MAEHLRNLARGQASSPAMSADDTQATMDTFIEGAPENLCELIREWLAGEGIQDTATLRTALQS